MKSFKDFIDAQTRGKYMTVGQFMLTLRPHDYKACVDSARDGDTLDSAVRAWAKVHAPDITLVDDGDDTDGDGKDFKIVDDDEDD